MIFALSSLFRGDVSLACPVFGSGHSKWGVQHDGSDHSEYGNAAVGLGGWDLGNAVALQLGLRMEENG